MGEKSEAEREAQARAACPKYARLSDEVDLARAALNEQLKLVPDEYPESYLWESRECHTLRSVYRRLIAAHRRYADFLVPAFKRGASDPSLSDDQRAMFRLEYEKLLAEQAWLDERLKNMPDEVIQ